MKVTRRTFVSGTLLSTLLIACERSSYFREKEEINAELDLGAVSSLLFSQLHIPEKAILLFRDIEGWSALSTRCTYHGCDLTFQEPILLCPCCKSAYALTGDVYSGGKASRALPWVTVGYRDGHLYAYPGKVTDSKQRFTTPEIEDAVRKLKVQIRDTSVAAGVKVPDALLGQKGEDSEGPMFLEEKQVLAE